jgi:acyl dehydratase
VPRSGVNEEVTIQIFNEIDRTICPSISFPSTMMHYTSRVGPCERAALESRRPYPCAFATDGGPYRLSDRTSAFAIDQLGKGRGLMNTVSMHFEEYSIGSRRETLGRTITEADIVIHAGQTGDFFPHHMDAEWCATQPFKRRIAHGTLVLSVAIGMTATDINPVALSYGYDRVRFIRPVYINDTIRVSATISDKRPHPKRSNQGIVVERVEAFNQQNEIVLSCEHLYLVDRTAPEA